MQGASVLSDRCKFKISLEKWIVKCYTETAPNNITQYNVQNTKKGKKTMAAKFLESSFTDKKQILRVITRDDAISMKKLDNGTTINVTGYVIQEITKEYDLAPDEEPEVFTSILVLDDKDQLYATRSDTFIRKIKEIVERLSDDSGSYDMAADPLPIRITRQTARSGREFVSCAYA